MNDTFLKSKAKHIMVFSGEISGQNHAYHLIKSLKSKLPDLVISGTGGDIMKSAGCNCITDITNLNCFQLGYFKKFLLRSKLNKHIKAIEEHVQQTLPSLFVIIGIADDTQYFVMKLLKLAKKYGIKTFYYFAPHVWLWSRKKTLKVAKEVDLIFTLFEKEETSYKKAGANTCFIGHPVYDELKEKADKSYFIKKFSLPENSRIIGLLPGSRKAEIKYHSNLFYKLCNYVTDSGYVFISGLEKSKFPEKILERYLVLKNHFFIENREEYYNLISSAELCLSCSGTAVLETAAYGTPQIAVYKLAYHNYFIIRLIAFFMKLKKLYVAMPNIILDEQIIPEYVQGKANKKKLKEAIHTFFSAPQKQSIALEKFNRILCGKGAINKAAKKICDSI